MHARRHRQSHTAAVGHKRLQGRGRNLRRVAPRPRRHGASGAHSVSGRRAPGGRARHARRYRGRSGRLTTTHVLEGRLLREAMSDPTTEVVLAGAAESSSNLAALLAEAGRLFYERRWVLGTSGNFSAVCGREPLRLVITSSGADKGALAPESFVE